MKFLFPITFLLLVNFLRSQELEFDEGIYGEKRITSDSIKHKYTVDNISYKLNRAFIFDYYYLDNSGVRKKFIATKDESLDDNPLNLTDYKNSTEKIIDKVKIEVTDNITMFIEFDPDYTQTGISIYYLDQKGNSDDTLCDYFRKKHGNLNDTPCGDEITGVIDNYKNLWIHPPRSYTFKILELCPFPFQYLDEKIKNWEWNLKVGGSYLDPRWINHTGGAIQIKYLYTRSKDEVLQTTFGAIPCKVTNSIASSEFGNNIMKTHLKSYYHPDYGFVKLEYNLINGAKLLMELVEVKN